MRMSYLRARGSEWPNERYIRTGATSASTPVNSLLLDYELRADHCTISQWPVVVGSSFSIRAIWLITERSITVKNCL